MKILLGTDNFYPNVNGAAVFTYELAKGLVKKGHGVFIIAPARKFKDTVSKLEGITVYGIRSIMIPQIIHPAKIRIPVAINQTKIKKIITDIGPQIIHVQDHFMIGSILVKVGRELGIPLIGTNHFMPENFLHYLYPPAFAKILLSEFAWKQFAGIYKHLDVITAPSKTAVLLIKDFGFKNPIIPVSCGVNLDRFNPKNKGSYLKKRYKITDKRPIVLYVGRLDQEKNIDLIIKAFADVIKSVDATLVLAGKGKEAANLVNLVKQLSIDKKVVFTGFVSAFDLPFLYPLASVFTIAGIAELQSIATLEAMASGLPVVATKAIALPELVKHGKNGYLFNQGNINQLTSQIIKILKNRSLQKKMSENSLKMIRRHDFNHTVSSYEDIYNPYIFNT